MSRWFCFISHEQVVLFRQELEDGGGLHWELSSRSGDVEALADYFTAMFRRKVFFLLLVSETWMVWSSLRLIQT